MNSTSAITEQKNDEAAAEALKAVKAELKAKRSAKRRHSFERKLSKKKYYCDYCDVFLRGYNERLRKEHNRSSKHMAAVESYWKRMALKASGEMEQCRVGAKQSLVEADSKRRGFSSSDSTTANTKTTTATPQQGVVRSSTVDACAASVVPPANITTNSTTTRTGGVQVAPGIVIGGKPATALAPGGSGGLMMPSVRVGVQPNVL